jgi:hypothetical protein
MPANQRLCSKPKTTDEIKSERKLMRRGVALRKSVRSIQRMRKERQNSSSISGTTNAAPRARAITSIQSSSPLLRRGSKPSPPPSTAHGMVRFTQAMSTNAPAAAAINVAGASGQLAILSSL